MPNMTPVLFKPIFYKLYFRLANTPDSKPDLIYSGMEFTDSQVCSYFALNFLRSSLNTPIDSGNNPLMFDAFVILNSNDNTAITYETSEFQNIIIPDLSTQNIDGALTSFFGANSQSIIIGNETIGLFTLDSTGIKYNGVSLNNQFPVSSLNTIPISNGSTFEYKTIEELTESKVIGGFSNPNSIDLQAYGLVVIGDSQGVNNGTAISINDNNHKFNVASSNVNITDEVIAFTPGTDGITLNGGGADINLVGGVEGTIEINGVTHNAIVNIKTGSSDIFIETAAVNPGISEGMVHIKCIPHESNAVTGEICVDTATGFLKIKS